MWEAYRHTRVHVEVAARLSVVVEATPGPVTEPWPPTGPSGWVITACNPRSRLLPPDENADRTRRLHVEPAAAGAPRFPPPTSTHWHPSWHEPGWLVPDIPEAQALDAGRRWGPNIVLAWTPASWSLVGVLIPHHEDHGWRLVDSGP